MRWTASRSIHASADAIFRVVADPAEFQRAVGQNPDVQYLTDRREGVGMKFRVTRKNKGKETAFVQEVAEYEPGRRLRLLNVTHGALWDTTFEIRESGASSSLTLSMTAVTKSFVQRLLMRLIGFAVQRGLDRDMDATKAYVERVATRTGVGA